MLHVYTCILMFFSPDSTLSPDTEPYTDRCMHLQSPDGVLAARDGYELGSSAFGPWGGLWNPCAGSKTPYGTRFGGEEVRAVTSAFQTSTSKHHA
jgi:hypothetical protein